MPYVAIMNWDAANRVTKCQDTFVTLAEAQALAAQGGVLLGTNTGAFAVVHPGVGGPSSWVVDPVAKTVALDPLPPPTPPTTDEIYNAAFIGGEPLNKVFKAYVLAVNDGSIVPGSNMTNAQLKTAVKAKM